MANTLQIQVPEEAMISLKLDGETFASEVLMLAAVKLFELGRPSSGLAAQLAGISRVEFLMSLSRYGVASFELTEDELKQDVLNA